MMSDDELLATNFGESPPSAGFKLTVDPFLNLQEHVSTFSQVSSDMQRAMTIIKMLTAREVLALAISPGTLLVTSVQTRTQPSLMK